MLKKIDNEKRIYNASVQSKSKHTTRNNLASTDDAQLNYDLNNIQINTTSESDYDESINENDELSDADKVDLISIKTATFANLIAPANSLRLNETSDNDHDEDSTDTSTDDDSYFESKANSIKMTNFKTRKHS